VLAFLIPVSYYRQEIVRKRNQKASRVKKLEAEIKSRQKKIHREIENVNQIKDYVNRKITKLKDEIVSLRNQEALELKKVDSIHWNKLRMIEEAKKDLKTQEKNEKYHLLKETQRNHIANKLSGHRVSSSRVPGLGIVKGFILSRSGVRTAADFTDVSVKKTFFTRHGARFKLRAGGTASVGWITPAQVNSLRRWRTKLEERYESSAPSKLSPDEEKKIKKKYQLQRDKLEEDEKKAKAEIQNEKGVIKDSFGKRHDSLREEVEEYKKHHDSVVGNARKGLASICDEIEKIDWEVNSLEHQLQGYESITFTNYMKGILNG
jgi:DNA-binding helix-hairpin-helix protein with protein kinase domain